MAAGLDAGVLGELGAQYRPRAVAPLEPWDLAGWQVKVYVLCAEGRSASPALLERARELAQAQCRADGAVGGLGLGTAIVHCGADGDYVVLVNWVEGYMSRTAIFLGPVEAPGLLRPAPAGLSPCVWELAVIAHERTVFVECVLQGGGAAEGVARWRSRVLAGQV